MARLKILLLLGFIVGGIYMHVNGYENRAHRNFEPLPDQSGEQSQEISPDQPLWFRDMSKDRSHIVKITMSKCFGTGAGCAKITVDLQDQADLLIKQSTYYQIKLTETEREFRAGPFVIRWSDNMKPLVVWNADNLKRGIKTDHIVKEAGVH